jgi:hypothetical protein
MPPPAKFTRQVMGQISALACADPETLDIPVSRWSQSEVARQSLARGILAAFRRVSSDRAVRIWPASGV